MTEVRKSLRLRSKRIREIRVNSPAALTPITGCSFELIQGLSQESSPPVGSPLWKKKSHRKSRKNLCRQFAESSPYVETVIDLIDASSLRESAVTFLRGPSLIENSSDSSVVVDPMQERVVPVNLLQQPFVTVVDNLQPDLEMQHLVDTVQPDPVMQSSGSVDSTLVSNPESLNVIQPDLTTVMKAGLQRDLECHLDFIAPLWMSNVADDVVISADGSDSDDCSNVASQPDIDTLERDFGISPRVEAALVEIAVSPCDPSVDVPPRTRIFKEVDRNLLEKCMNDGDNPSVRNDKWLRNRFDLWKRDTNRPDLKSIEDYNIEELADLMTHFFLALCKDSGDRYPSGSIGNLYNSLNRILRRAQKKRIRLTKVNEVEFKLRQCVFFDTVTRAVEEAMKLSIDSGANKPRRKVKVISFSEEYTILGHESHQMHHPRGLQKRIAWYCTVVFLVRGCQELRDLEYQDFKIKVNPLSSKKFVQYTERTSKNHKATVTKCQQEHFRRPVNSYDEDVVACWEKYDSHLASDMKSGAFFLGPLDEPRTSVWYKRTNVGLGTVRRWVKQMAEIAGVTGDITNKSGRATAITRMSLAGVPKNVICGVTGHKNPNMLDRYDATLDLEHEAAQRASRESYLGSSSMSYTQCRESTVSEYRELQIAPVQVQPTANVLLPITDVSNRSVCPIIPARPDCCTPLSAIRHITWSEPIADPMLDLLSPVVRPEPVTNHNGFSHPEINPETPLRDLFQAASGRHQIQNSNSSSQYRQACVPEVSVPRSSVPENLPVNHRNFNRLPIRPYGQHRRSPPQFVNQWSRVMDRPNPYSRSFAPWTSPVMPASTLLQSTPGRGSNPHVNEEVTVPYRNNLGSRMQDHVPIVYQEVKLDNVQIDSYNFTPDEELLDLDLDANSLSRRATSSSSSLSAAVQDHFSEPPCSISVPAPRAVTSVPVTKPVGVTSKVATPSNQEVIPYIEQSDVAAMTSGVASTMATPALPPALAAAIPATPAASPFGNVTHVNFVFTKEMDFGSLMAALGK